jgi:signal transduction histidine kinase
MISWVKRFEGYSKALMVAICLALVGIIGWVDWKTGTELSFSVFYVIPVALAVWFVGEWFGIVVSLLSVAVWVWGDLKAGAWRHSQPYVPVWNAMISAVFFFVVVAILTRLRKIALELEKRVQQRTAALTNEIKERTRLEQELLHISEREQRRIGHDLHDSLCQHLTGTALAGQVLGERLAEKSPLEAEAANQVVKLVEEAIDLTRTLARGLAPADLEGENFLESFREMAAHINERFKVSCRFEFSPTGRIRAPGGAIHLYRIAQEAINNAMKHGKAKNIMIRMIKNGEQLVLSIRDDGTGLAGNGRNGAGMGLRIMEHRASLIGASFQIERLPEGGTQVTCVMPAEAGKTAEIYAQE